MTVPSYDPQPLAELRARYVHALSPIYDYNVIIKTGVIEGGRPGDKPRHKFDFEDGLRLIISRECGLPKPYRKNEVLLHLSASVTRNSQLWSRLMFIGQATGAARPQVEMVLKRAEEAFRQLSDWEGPIKLLGLSDWKGIPHWYIRDYKYERKKNHDVHA